MVDAEPDGRIGAGATVGVDEVGLDSDSMLGASAEYELSQPTFPCHWTAGHLHSLELRFPRRLLQSSDFDCYPIAVRELLSNSSSANQGVEGYLPIH
ncbi:UNVERIFIED_CONTAM: hypothetical protein K2H54_075922 [Gekko kuhli]